MEFLKGLFGENALTYDQLVEKATKAGVKAVNLAQGGYVHLEKFKRVEGQCRQLREQLARWQQQAGQMEDEHLKKRQEQWEQQYQQAQGQIHQLEGKLAQQNLESRVELALTKAHARNLRAAKALMDLDRLQPAQQESDKDWRMRIDTMVQQIAEENPFLFGGEQLPPPPMRACAEENVVEADRWRQEAGLPCGDWMKGE